MQHGLYEIQFGVKSSCEYRWSILESLLHKISAFLQMNDIMGAILCNLP
jgi:hypothetical protein